MICELFAHSNYYFITWNDDNICVQNSNTFQNPLSGCCFSRQGQFTIVPVMVGSLSTERELMYGHIFSKYLADPANLFVISSDFCHWGTYTSFLSSRFAMRLKSYNKMRAIFSNCCVTMWWWCTNYSMFFIIWNGNREALIYPQSDN